MALMEDRHEPLRPWPTSECEFVLTSHLQAQLEYHLEFECQNLDQCTAPLTYHVVALTALLDLRTLWNKRKPAF